MSAKRKIAIVRPDSNFTSGQFYNSQEVGLARGLSLLGVGVDIYVATDEKSVSHSVVDSKGEGQVRLFRMPYFKVPEIDHAIYPKLNKTLHENKYDLIQVNEENELTCFNVARYAKKNSIPVIVYQGMYRPLTGRIRAAFQSFYNIFLRNKFQRYISLPVAKTNRARLYLERNGYDDVAVLPVGLDVNAFEESETIDWDSKLGIEPDQKVLLYVGIFEERRNIDFLLDVAKQLQDRRVVLALAGDGEIFSKVKSRIENENLENVKLLGKVNQKSLPSLYQRSDIFLLASDYEIYGMVLLEAMYFGVPVFSTKTAGPEDVIESGKNGLLFDKMNVSEWAKAVEDLVFSEAELSDMSREAKEKVQADLTWESIAKKYAANIINKLA